MTQMLITYIKAESQFLKIWGIQNSAQEIVHHFERNFHNLKEKLDASSGFLRSNQIPTDFTCAARSQIRNAYCRARVLAILSATDVLIKLMDYGDEEVVSVSDLRAVDEYFLKFPPQATESILADVRPMSGSQWTTTAVHYCVTELLRKKVTYFKVGEYHGIPIARIAKIGENSPFAQYLIDGGHAAVKQEAVAPPTPPVLSYIHVPLNANTVHQVKLSFIENNHKFHIQMFSMEQNLQNLMKEINRYASTNTLLPVESPAVNMPCLATYGGKSSYYRAIITSLESPRCTVLYVDYGCEEVKTLTSLHVIPPTFLKIPAYATLCSLDRELNFPQNEIHLYSKYTPVDCLVLGHMGVQHIVQISLPGGEPLPQAVRIASQFSAGAPVPPTGQQFTASIPQLPLTFKQPPLQVNLTHDVNVVHVGSVSEFYCQLSSFSERFQRITSLLTSGANLPQITIEECVPNCPVVAKFSDNDEWYRAIIIKVNSDRDIQVYFVDFGNCDNVSIRDIRRIHVELVQHPIQTYRCFMQEFETLPAQKKDEMLDELEVLVMSPVRMQVRSVAADGQRYSVTLFDNSSTSINDKLVGKLASHPPVAANPITQLPVDKIERLSVTSFTSPSLFFGQFEKVNLQKLDEMQSSISQFYSTAQNNGFQPKAGQFVVGKYLVDESFYRAKVEKVLADHCELIFIDYGNRETVHMRDIHPLNSKFLSYPQFGMFCGLETYPPTTPVDKIYAIIMDNTVEVNIIREVKSESKWIVTFTETFAKNAPILELLRQHEEVVPRSILGVGSRGYPESKPDTNHNYESRGACAVRNPLPMVPNANRPVDKHAYELISLPPNAVRNVTVCFVENPSEFYVQIEEENSKLELLMNEINKQYSKMGAGEMTFDRFVVGVPCCAVFSQDETWYRGQISKVDSGSCDIYFVDYGNSESVVHSKIKRLTSDFCVSLAPQAIKCTTYNIAPNKGTWTDDDIEAFNEMTLEKSFIGQFIQCKNEVYSINLISTSKIQDDALNKEFVALGHGNMADGSKVTKVTSAVSGNMEETASSFKSTREDYNANESSGYDKNKYTSAAATTYKSDADYQSLRPDNYKSGGYGNRQSPRSDKSGGSRDYQSSRSDTYKSGGSNDYQSRSDNYKSGGSSKYQSGSSNDYQSRSDNYRSGGSNDYQSRSDNYKSGGSSNYQSRSGSDSYKSGVSNNYRSGGSSSYQSKSNEYKSDSSSNYTLVPASNFKSASNSSFKMPVVHEGSSEIVTVTYGITPAEIFCQLKSSEADFKKMMNELQDFYSRSPGSESTLDYPTVGNICIAQFHLDSVYYRAEVLKVAGSMLSVFYVDYGNVESVDILKVRAISEDFISLPKQAIKCTMTGIQAPGETWEVSGDIGSFFEGETRCTFAEKSGDSYLIRLTCNGKDVAQKLVECGKAVSSGSSGLSPPNRQPLQPKASLAVVLSYIESPYRFWCQLMDETTKLDDLTLALSAHFEKGSSTADANLKVGNYCLSKYAQDEDWYRAQVKSKKSSGEFEVFFIDYGNTADVTADQTSKIVPEFVKSPPICFECRLMGAPAIVDKDKVEEFRKLVDLDIELTAEVARMANSVAIVTLTYEKEGAKVIVNEELFGPVTDVQIDVAKFLQPEIQLGLQEGYTSIINNPQDFFIQLSSCETALEQLTTELSESCETAAEFPIGSIEIGCACAAKFEDDQWYRAEVITIEGSSVGVLFVDYGNESRIEANTLKVLDQKFLDVPPYSMRSKLKGVAPIGDSWSEVTIDAFSEIVNESLLAITFISKHTPALVNIAKDDKCVAQALIEANHAVKVETDETYAEDQLASAEDDQMHSLTLDRNYLKRKLKSGKFSATVCFVHSHDKFFITPSELDTELDTVMNALKLLYSQETPEVKNMVLEEAKINQPCAAKYSDGAWYRAVVTAVAGELITISFIDYGNEEIVTLEALKPLPPELAEVPPIAVECTLFGIKPIEGKESEIFAKLEAFVDERVEVEVEVFSKDKPYAIRIYPDFMDGLISESLAFEVDTVAKSTTTDIVDAKLIIPQRALPQEKDLSVRVKHNEFEDDLIVLYGVQSDLNTKLDNFQEKLQIACNDVEKKPMKVEALDYCVAKYTDDQWYRAQVNYFTEDGILLKFVDYGNNEIVDMSNVCTLPPEFAKEPQFSFKFCLFGLEVEKSRQDDVQTEIDLRFYCDCVSIHICEFHQGLSAVCVDSLLCDDDEVDFAELLISKELAARRYTSNTAISNRFEATVEKVVEDLVYVLPTNLKNDRDLLWNHLREACETVIDRATEVKLGHLYAVQIDEKWHRVSIVNATDSESTVKCVDSGDDAEVELSSVVNLPKELQHRPLLLIPCTVDNKEKALSVAGKDDIVSFEIEDYAESCYPHYPLRVKFFDSKVCDPISESKESVAHRYPKRELKSGMLPASVSFVYSHDRFFITPSEFSAELEFVTDELAKLCDDETEKVILKNLEVHHPCVAKYSEDGAWYRAVISNIENDSITVNFVDYGNMEVVGLESLKLLPPELAEIPPIAVECKLFGLTPINGKESEITAQLEVLRADELEIQIEVHRDEQPCQIKIVCPDIERVLFLKDLVTETQEDSKYESLNLIGESEDKSTSAIETKAGSQVNDGLKAEIESDKGEIEEDSTSYIDAQAEADLLENIKNRELQVNDHLKSEEMINNIESIEELQLNDTAAEGDSNNAEIEEDSASYIDARAESEIIVRVNNIENTEGLQINDNMKSQEKIANKEELKVNDLPDEGNLNVAESEDPESCETISECQETESATQPSTLNLVAGIASFTSNLSNANPYVDDNDCPEAETARDHNIAAHSMAINEDENPESSIGDCSSEKLESERPEAEAESELPESCVDIAEPYSEEPDKNSMEPECNISAASSDTELYTPPENLNENASTDDHSDGSFASPAKISPNAKSVRDTGDSEAKADKDPDANDSAFMELSENGVDLVAGIVPESEIPVVGLEPIDKYEDNLEANSSALQSELDVDERPECDIKESAAKVDASVENELKDRVDNAAFNVIEGHHENNVPTEVKLDAGTSGHDKAEADHGKVYELPKVIISEGHHKAKVSHICSKSGSIQMFVHILSMSLSFEALHESMQKEYCTENNSIELKEGQFYAVHHNGRWERGQCVIVDGKSAIYLVDTGEIMSDFSNFTSLLPSHLLEPPFAIPCEIPTIVPNSAGNVNKLKKLFKKISFDVNVADELSGDVRVKLMGEELLGKIKGIAGHVTK